jgi:TRAP-type C4-dicarboxylate transport system substrate-binding protein
MKKKARLICLAATLVVAVTFVLVGFLAQPDTARSAEPIVLKAVTAWPKPVTDNQAFFLFVDIVNEKVAKEAPGALEIKYLGGPEAVKTMEQPQALQTGVIDMCFTTTAYYTSILPEVDAVKLSAFTASQERTNGAWAYLNSLHEKVGIYYLARLGLDTKFHLYLKKPINKATLKGLNIRVSPMYLQGVKALGGNPVVIPPTDVYTSLERGVVDGYCWPAFGIKDWGWDKLTKYVVDPGFYVVPNPVLMNLKTWNKLPKNLQDLLTAAAIEAEKQATAHFAKLAVADRPMLIKEGIKVITLSPTESKKFIKAFYDPAWEDILKKSPKVGAELKKLLTKKM